MQEIRETSEFLELLISDKNTRRTAKDWAAGHSAQAFCPRPPPDLCRIGRRLALVGKGLIGD